MNNSRTETIGELVVVEYRVQTLVTCGAVCALWFVGAQRYSGGIWRRRDCQWLVVAATRVPERRRLLVGKTRARPPPGVN